MMIKDKIELLLNSIKESLDLKGKYIRYREHDKLRLDECMLVDHCNITFEKNEINYEIVGTILIPYESTFLPNFSLVGGSHTYSFSLNDLLEEKCAINCIEEITKEEFESILDGYIKSWKEYTK